MPSYINGVDASLITGLGQIGVTPSITYPTGGLIANSGAPGTGYDGKTTTIYSLNGYSGSIPSWYQRPLFGAGVSSASVWTKIVSNTNAVYCLSSSGELFSAGNSYTYTGRTSSGFVNGRLDKVILVTPTSSWTDITMTQLAAIGINNGYLYGTGAPNSGEFGSGSATYSNFGTWRQISTNQGWVRVEGGQTHTLFMSGSSKASGSVWISGNNGSGRTGMNTATGTTNNRAEPFGKTGSIWTDISAGTVTTYLVSGGQFFGTGLNSNYQLGDGGITQRNAFGNAISVAGFTVDKVFAGVQFGKVITTESFMCHTGNQSYSRGDGSTAQITTWTRLHTASAEFSASWSGFQWPRFVNSYIGAIGVNRNRPYYLAPGSHTYAAIFPSESAPYQSATYKAGSVNNSTWQPFFSGSFASNLNITASHDDMAFTTYNSDTTNGLYALWMYLTPH